MALVASRSNPTTDGPVSTAIREEHPSIKPALRLAKAEVDELQQTLGVAQHASFSGAAYAPAFFTCRRVEVLQPGRVSILCQVRVGKSFKFKLCASQLCSEELKSSALN